MYDRPNANKGGQMKMVVNLEKVLPSVLAGIKKMQAGERFRTRNAAGVTAVYQILQTDPHPLMVGAARGSAHVEVEEIVGEFAGIVELAPQPAHATFWYEYYPYREVRSR